MFLNNQQLQAISDPSNRIIINASAGTGKSLKNGTPILTNRGWVPIERLSLEDKIAARDGKFYTLLGIFPQQAEQQVCEVVFSDRTKIYCSPDHLWIYQTASMRNYKNQFSVKTLSEIFNTVPLKINSGKNLKNNCYIPMAEPINFLPQEVPLDPYLLGCLLGDGGLSSGVVFTVAEQDIKEKVENILYRYGCKLIYKSQYDYSISGPLGYGYHKNQNQIAGAIRDLKLFGTLSDTKFIPDIYKYNSTEVRLEILKGIIDTDGYCEGSSYDITLKSKQLVFDIKEICESLGLTATYSEKESRCSTAGYEKECGTVFRLHIKTSKTFPKLHSSIKRESQWKKPQAYARRSIETIKFTNDFAKMTCISVDSPDHSFICQNFIVTHNTSAIIAAAEQHKFGSTVLITFTNKAADEMKLRLSYQPYYVGTIHGFAKLELLKLAKKYDFRVRLLKETSIRKIIRLIFEENDFGIYVSNVALNEAFQVIVNDEIELSPRKMKLYYEVKKQYDKYKEQNQLYDYTDTPKYLLKKLKDYNITLEHDLVLVDEAQDLDSVQYELIQRLGRRIIAIGDPKQSIYIFRGATSEIFNKFIEDGYESHTLDINYRSKQEIIDNAGVKLNCERGTGGLVTNTVDILKYGPMILCRTNHEVDEIKKYYPSVMTVHGAKGLEFINVCIVDFNVDDEEDENIMFVALTRAKDRIGVLKYSDVIKYLRNSEEIYD